MQRKLLFFRVIENKETEEPESNAIPRIGGYERQAETGRLG
jgi:hypothetical protein